ncbi:twin-arginine translocation signal domain-containing protein [Brachybacterium hainanense]|uniref:Twin-arginine translocation signal domain-containing protein n=1 Tax=Brachybacterium hainanense TaxID=1541174 RepID=A0ABV6RDX7_9MICO
MGGRDCQCTDRQSPPRIPERWCCGSVIEISRRSLMGATGIAALAALAGCAPQDQPASRSKRGCTRTA